MTVTEAPTTSVGTATGRHRHPRGVGPRRARWLQAYTWLIVLWLMTPIFVIIAFGFNNTKGKFNYTWQGFTLHWYRHLFDISDLTNALINSITIAVIVTAIS